MLDFTDKQEVRELFEGQFWPVCVIVSYMGEWHG